MEDETLELHFETITKAQETASETTQTGFLNMGKAMDRIEERALVTETRVATVEVEVSRLQVMAEKFKANPLMQVGTGTLGGGGIATAIWLYLQSGAVTPP